MVDSLSDNVMSLMLIRASNQLHFEVQLVWAMLNIKILFFLELNLCSVWKLVRDLCPKPSIWNSEDKLTTVRKTCWRCEKGWLVLDAIYWLPRRKPTRLSNFFSIFRRPVALSSTKCNSCRRSNPTCLQQRFTHVRPVQIHKAEPKKSGRIFLQSDPTWSSDKCT